MNPSVVLHSVLVALFAFATGCRENEKSPKEANTPEAQPLKENNREELKDSTGEAVKLAARDPALSAEIRESAALFERMLQNEPINRKDFDQMRAKLASIRTERTCKIWISLLLATEARIPDPLPTKQETIELEKLVLEKKIEVLDVESLRFTTLLHPCVKTLTQYDIPEADIQVERFMKRFELKYGASEAGRAILESLKIEISQAMEARQSEVVPWKLRLAKEAAERK